MRKRATIVIFAIAIIGAGGVVLAITTAGDGAAPQEEAVSREEAIMVTGGPYRGPPACAPREVARLLRGFLDEFNRGATPATVRSFFSKRSFVMFAVFLEVPRGRPKGFRATAVNHLLRYFKGRQRARERMSLEEVGVRYEARRDLGQMSVKVTRTADDLPEKKLSSFGKGAIDCANRRIVVWSLATPRSKSSPITAGGPRCPRPPAPVGRETTIACA